MPLAGRLKPRRRPVDLPGGVISNRSPRPPIGEPSESLPSVPGYETDTATLPEWVTGHLPDVSVTLALGEHRRPLAVRCSVSGAPATSVSQRRDFRRATWPDLCGGLSSTRTIPLRCPSGVGGGRWRCRMPPATASTTPDDPRAGVGTRGGSLGHGRVSGARVGALVPSAARAPMTFCSHACSSGATWRIRRRAHSVRSRRDPTAASDPAMA